MQERNWQRGPSLFEAVNLLFRKGWELVDNPLARTLYGLSIGQGCLTISDAQKMIIRLAQLTDLPAIVEIYNQSIPSKQSTGDTQSLRVDERLTWFDEHRPEQHPIFVTDADGQVAGWCSLSAYRPGRAALRFTVEISYYIAYAYHRRGIATALVEHTLAVCPALGIRHVFAIVLEGNQASLNLLEKMGFQQWGYLPRVANFDGKEVGHLYYGRHV